jgi:hypothetical protein
MNWNDVLIVGDSFCSARSEDWHWPRIFTLELTGLIVKDKIVPRGKGFNGASWWSSRNCILKELKRQIPKIAIFLHTEPLRIPSDKDWGINYRSVELKKIHTTDSMDEDMSEDFALAGKLYYEQLISFGFHEWAVLQWFKELDELTQSIEKVIHIYCFDGIYDKYTFRHGVTLGYPLFKYQHQTPIFKKNLELVANHFNMQTNKKFADSLLELVKTYPGNGVRIDNAII